MMVLWHVMAYIARAHLLAEMLEQIHMMQHSEQNMMAEGHKQRKDKDTVVTVGVQTLADAQRYVGSLRYNGFRGNIIIGVMCASIAEDAAEYFKESPVRI